jgi:hypothetical protein
MFGSEVDDDSKMEDEEDDDDESFKGSMDLDSVKKFQLNRPKDSKSTDAKKFQQTSPIISKSSIPSEPVQTPQFSTVPSVPKELPNLSLPSPFQPNLQHTQSSLFHPTQQYVVQSKTQPSPQQTLQPIPPSLPQQKPFSLPIRSSGFSSYKPRNKIIDSPDSRGSVEDAQKIAFSKPSNGQTTTDSQQQAVIQQRAEQKKVEDAKMQNKQIMDQTIPLKIQDVVTVRQEIGVQQVDKPMENVRDEKPMVEKIHDIRTTDTPFRLAEKKPKQAEQSNRDSFTTSIIC